VNRSRATVTVDAPVDACFAYVGDHHNATQFMLGIKRYEPLTQQTEGKGARFLAVVEVAGRKLEAEMEITEWVDGEKMLAVSRKGPKTEGGWSFEEYDDGTTDITLSYAYEVPGVFRLLPRRLIEGIVERGLQHSLRRLKDQIERASRVGTRTGRGRTQ
jgi:uncharacterized membrane protein